MKLVICGGRHYRLNDEDFELLDKLHAEHKITEVVSGACAGADKDGEAWAERNGIPVKQFMPAWDDQGSAAGPIRNQAMADYADACIAFPGGRGTQDMLNKARAKGMRLIIERSVERFGRGE